MVLQIVCSWSYLRKTFASEHKNRCALIEALLLGLERCKRATVVQLWLHFAVCS